MWQEAWAVLPPIASTFVVAQACTHFLIMIPWITEIATPPRRGGAWWGMIACMLRDASRAKKSINWHERTKHENVRFISLTWQKIAWELRPKNPKYVLRRINETSCRGSDRCYTLKLPILPILLGCCIFWESSAAASQSTALEQHQGSPWKTRRQFTHNICDPESFKWCKSAESANLIAT